MKTTTSSLLLWNPSAARTARLAAAGVTVGLATAAWAKGLDVTVLELARNWRGLTVEAPAKPGRRRKRAA